MYPLGGGSPWLNNELRYSLRSVEKHLKGVRDVYIVGEKPSWLKNVIHLPFVDALMWKEINIFRKILHVSEHSDISQNFLFMNDDHFILSDFDAQNFPFYYKNTLDDAIARKYGEGRYKRALVNTRDALMKRGYTRYNYDGHCPIIYNRQNIIKLSNMYDWNPDNVGPGYVGKSLYGNTFEVKGEYSVDCKIHMQMYPDEIFNVIKDKKFFSIGNAILQPTPEDLTTVMEQLYPNKSKWEGD